MKTALAWYENSHKAGGENSNALYPTPVLLPGKSHGQRGLVGCSPWGRYDLDTTYRLHFHFSLSCVGEGNGNPLQCSCLENPRDGGAWWAAVYGVSQSRTRPKRLSSSSSSVETIKMILKKKTIKDNARKTNLSHEHLSVQFSYSVVFDSLQPHEPQHTKPPCPYT